MLVLSLSFGGFAHAIVPHSHGDEHNHEAAIWTDLHGSFLHEAKKFVLALDTSLLLILAFVIVAVACARREMLAARASDPVSGEPLRRGLSRYRAFR